MPRASRPSDPRHVPGEIELSSRARAGAGPSGRGRDLAYGGSGRYEAGPAPLSPRRRNVKRSMVRFLASALSVLALTFAAAAPAYAGPGTDTVKAKQATLFDLLKQGTPDAQKKID